MIPLSAEIKYPYVMGWSMGKVDYNLALAQRGF